MFGMMIKGFIVISMFSTVTEVVKTTGTCCIFDFKTFFHHSKHCRSSFKDRLEIKRIKYNEICYVM